MKTPIAVLCLMVAACHKSPDAKPGAAAAAPAAAKASGLHATDNDAKVVSLATEALRCPKDDRELFDRGCAAFKAWSSAKEVAAAEPTLFNLLDDADERVRLLGARGLSDATFDEGACKYRKDATLAVRLIAVAAKEPSPEVAESLGRRVGRIDVEATKQLDAIAALVKERKQPDQVRAILSGLLFSNLRSRAAYDFMIGMTNDSNVRFRYDAVEAFWVGGHLDKPATCKMWEAHLDDEDDAIAGMSAQHLGWWEDCSANFDTLLGKLEARHKSGRNLGKGAGIGLTQLCEDKQARPAQRAKAAAIAKQLAANKKEDEFPRVEGLEAAIACDRAHGKSFVARFKHDPSDWVANKAKDLASAK
jgi:hypothetical protein